MKMYAVPERNRAGRALAAQHREAVAGGQESGVARGSAAGPARNAGATFSSAAPIL